MIKVCGRKKKSILCKQKISFTETNDLPGDNLVTKSSTDDCNNDNSSAQRSAASDNDTDGESCSTSRRKIYKRRLISSNLKTVLIKKVITRKSKSPPVVKSERDSLKAEKLYIKENLQTISGQIKLINESKANKKLAHLLMGSLSTHVDKIVDTVRIRKKSKTKSTRSAQIVDLKNGKLDLNTPESILTSLNLADVINRKIFDQLPSYYQYRITKLLPHCDQVIMGNNVICPTLTAFSNEFFSKSIVSYAGRLSDGKLTSESISKLKKEIEREKNRLDPLKLKYFEPYFKIPEEEKPADLSDDERVQVDLTFLDTMATCFDKFVQIKSKTNFDNNDSVDGEKCSKPLQVRFDESVILCAEDFKKLFLSLKNQLNTSSDEPEVKNKVDNNNSELCLDNSKPLEQLDYEEQLAFNQIVIDDYLKPKEARMKFSEESFDEILCNNLICYNVITGGILINWSSYYHLLDMCVKLIKLLGHALKSYMPHFDVMSKCGDIILSPLRDFSDRCLEFVNSLNRISDIELVPVNIDCFEQATIPKIFLKKVYSQSVPSETSLPALVYFNDVRIKTFNTFMASSQRMQVKLRQLIHFMPYKPIGSITAHIETIASFSSFVSFCQSTIPMLCHVPEDQIFPDEEEFEGEEEEEEEEDEEED